MNRLFMGCGQNVSYFPRMLPLYPELIRFHNNIVVGSNVSFITHDAIHLVLPTDSPGGGYIHMEKAGCIEIMDNVFIGAGSTVLYGVKIGSNCIIGADTLVCEDLEENGVYAGIPAVRIGSFENYLKKRRSYRGAVVKRSQKITRQEVIYAWNVFRQEHSQGRCVTGKQGEQ